VFGVNFLSSVFLLVFIVPALVLLLG
jgi:hypothetical protein